MSRESEKPNPYNPPSHDGLMVNGVFMTWDEHEAMIQALPRPLQQCLVPMDIHAYFKRFNISMDDDPPPPSPAPFVPAASHHRDSPESKYARAALAEEATAVARAMPGTRNDVLNKAAYKLYGLVASGTLSATEVDTTLTNAARAAGLEVEEIGKTLGSAAAKGGARPRDLSHVGAEQREREAEFLAFADGLLANPVVFDLQATAAQPAPAVVANAATECPPGLEDNPHRLARLFARRVQHPDGLRLRFWRDEFYWWDNVTYRQLPAKEIRAELTGFIEAEFHRLWVKAAAAFKMRAAGRGQGGQEGGGQGGQEGGKPQAIPKPIPVTTRLIGDVLQALAGVCLLQSSVCRDMPQWLTDDPGRLDWAAVDVLPARNCLVHLPSAVSSDPAVRAAGMRPTTPLYFSTHALDYDFVPSPPPPTQWLAFLAQIWPEDPESVQLLQEWMGLLLTADTSLQKILFCIGPKRSGKGTIIRIIQAMIGEANVVNPTLSGLTTQFGLEPLLNKSSAIITDARISAKTDTSIAIERLLSISGEDNQTVGRKHKDSLTVKLPTRFTLVSNELPQMRDASGALVGRMLFLRLTNSFFGREDPKLFGKLRVELPGILVWSIEGLRRLRERGKLVQPASAMEDLESMSDLSSPIHAFVEDCCELAPEGEWGAKWSGDDYRVPCQTLFGAWSSWCRSKGIGKPGTAQVFGRNLRAAYPRIVSGERMRGENASRPKAYQGVRLAREPTEMGSGAVQLEFDDDSNRRNYEGYGVGEGYAPFKDYEDD